MPVGNDTHNVFGCSTEIDPQSLWDYQRWAYTVCWCCWPPRQQCVDALRWKRWWCGWETSPWSISGNRKDSQYRVWHNQGHIINSQQPSHWFLLTRMGTPAYPPDESSTTKQVAVSPVSQCINSLIFHQLCVDPPTMPIVVWRVGLGDIENFL